MPPAFVKDVAQFASSVMSPTANPVPVTVPAGGVAAGNTVVIFAVANQDNFHTVTDARGNTYRVRSTGISGTNLIDGTLATSLLAGDKIFLQKNHDAACTLVIAEFSGLSANPLDALASRIFSGTAALAGGAVANSSPNGLVLGCFEALPYSAQLSAAGAGFTNMTGRIGTTSMDGNTSAVDWEYKIGGISNPVTADATLSVSGSGSALTVVYRDHTPNQMMGVV